MRQRSSDIGRSFPFLLPPFPSLTPFPFPPPLIQLGRWGSAASYCTAIDLFYDGTNHTISYGDENSVLHA